MLYRFFALPLAAVALATAANPEPRLAPTAKVYVGYSDPKWDATMQKAKAVTGDTLFSDAVITALNEKGAPVTLIHERKDAEYLLAIDGGSQNVSGGTVARSSYGRYSSSTRVYEDVKRQTQVAAKLIDMKSNAILWSKSYAGGKSQQSVAEMLAKELRKWIEGK